MAFGKFLPCNEHNLGPLHLKILIFQIISFFFSMFIIAITVVAVIVLISLFYSCNKVREKLEVIT